MKRITLATLMFIVVAAPALYTTHDTTFAQFLQFDLRCEPIDNAPLSCPEGVEFPDCCIQSIPHYCIGQEVATSDLSADCHACGGRLVVEPGAAVGACFCAVANSCF